jgi:hypothetical protein
MRQLDTARRDSIRGHSIPFGRKTMIISVSALLAAQSEMSSSERISHTAGRYTEGLHYERPEDEGQYKGGYQPLEGIRNFSGYIFSFSSFFAFIYRHKCCSCCKLGSRIDSYIKLSKYKMFNYADKSLTGQ